jgi:hypothetical protein
MVNSKRSTIAAKRRLIDAILNPKVSLWQWTIELSRLAQQRGLERLIAAERRAGRMIKLGR